MKISWGIKIIITFVIFASVIGTMVGISMTKNIDLVFENYYERDLKYQDKINMIKRTRMRKDKIEVETTASSIIIYYPKTLTNDRITGNINFYRAMDKKKDFSVYITKDNNSSQEINTSHLDKGNWKIQILWSVNGEDYFNEEDIFIN